MSSSSPQSELRPTDLVSLFLSFLAFIGIPGTAVIAFFDAITKNPWQTLSLAVLYGGCILALTFLRKVLRNLINRWSNETAKWLDRLLRKQWFSYYGYYMRYLTFQHRDFDIKGLSTQSTYTLELEHVFVDLKMDPKPMHLVSSNPIPTSVPDLLRTGQHSLWQYLAIQPLRRQHLVILGAPGSGKTTLLKHLALTFANRRKKWRLDRSLRVYRLPFLLFLREHAEAILGNANYSLIDAIETALRAWDRPVPDDWVRQMLCKGNCLILLDGLDEVADDQKREQVVKWVQQQMSCFACNRFLITSRPFGYRNNPLQNVVVLEVQAFTYEQTEQFVQHWYRANEIMSSQKDDPGVRMRASRGARDLLKRIQNTDALSSLSVNPLLLTMIATIHRYRSTLPGKRVELYAEICEVFLGKRQQARDQQIELRPSQSIRVLQALAYAMMVQKKREFTKKEAKESIREALALVHERMSPTYFLQMVEQMSGLLLEREVGCYSFAHLTFQEYLASAHIREQGLEATLIWLIGDSWWRETTLLYCAQAEATQILAACLKRAASSVPHLMLALECQEEALQIQPAVKAKLEQLIIQNVEDSSAERRRVIAETLLQKRLQEFVPVEGESYQDVSLVTCAEYQLFLDEQREQNHIFAPDHWVGLQYPSGGGLQPVLGIRPSDARAFCRWLTQREQGLWHYRLPGANENLLVKIATLPDWLPENARLLDIGYWEEAAKEASFAWIQRSNFVVPGASSLAAQADVAPLDLDLGTIAAARSSLVLAEGFDWKRSFLYYIDLVGRGARVFDNDSVLSYALKNVVDLTIDRDLDIDRAIGNTIDRTLDLDRARTHDHARALELTRALDRAIARALDLARVLDIPRLHDRDLVRASRALLEIARRRRQHSSHILEYVRLLALLYVCACLCTYNLLKASPALSSQSLWQRLLQLPSEQRNRIMDTQLSLNRGVAIVERLERLIQRRKGMDQACEGILIMRERRREEAAPA